MSQHRVLMFKYHVIWLDDDNDLRRKEFETQVEAEEFLRSFDWMHHKHIICYGLLRSTMAAESQEAR